MAAINLRGISKQFNHVVAENNVDLQVKDRGFMAILGPSGSGTELLKLPFF